MLGHLLCQEVWLLHAAIAQMQLRLNDTQEITIKEHLPMLRGSI